MTRSTWRSVGLFVAGAAASAALVGSRPTAQAQEASAPPPCKQCAAEPAPVVADRFQLRRDEPKLLTVFDTATGRLYTLEDGKTVRVLDPVRATVSERDVQDDRNGRVIRAR